MLDTNADPLCINSIPGSALVSGAIQALATLRCCCEVGRRAGVSSFCARSRWLGLILGIGSRALVTRMFEHHDVDSLEGARKGEAFVEDQSVRAKKQEPAMQS